jgi:hypothetical protein
MNRYYLATVTRPDHAEANLWVGAICPSDAAKLVAGYVPVGFSVRVHRMGVTSINPDLEQLADDIWKA